LKESSYSVALNGQFDRMSALSNQARIWETIGAIGSIVEASAIKVKDGEIAHECTNRRTDNL
jgi:hypothetical protein